MEETEFQKTADNTLSVLSDQLENADDEGQLDVDLLNGILNIRLPDSRQYVINKHAPTRQIWLSSPISGAGHFSYDAASQKWFDREKRELNAVIYKEVGNIIGKVIR